MFELPPIQPITDFTHIFEPDCVVAGNTLEEIYRVYANERNKYGLGGCTVYYGCCLRPVPLELQSLWNEYCVGQWEKYRREDFAKCEADPQDSSRPPA